MKLRVHPAAVAIFAAIACAAPVMAHGWAVPPTPPYTPAGGGTPEYQGAIGGGDGAQAEVTTPVVPTVATPSGPNLNPLGRTTTATKPVVAGRPTASMNRPKTTRAPWLEDVNVPWQPVFAPVAHNAGYAKVQTDVLGGVTLKPEEGGWRRDHSRALVLVVDPSKAEQVKALQALEADSRFVAAANLFDCFRVDARSLSKAPGSVTLSAFDAQGNLVGQMTGRQIRKGFDLLEKAWGKGLSSKAQTALAHLGGIAYYEHHMGQLEKAIVCPDCGHERNDVTQRLETMKLRREAHCKGLATLDD